MLNEDTKAARQESSFSHSCAVHALARLRCQARKVVIIILPAAARTACGKTTREQLSNFETTAVCKLHTDVAVAKVNIQFQQISFSPTLLLAGAATVIIGDKCLHHFCCPRDDEASTPFLLHAVRDAAAC